MKRKMLRSPCSCKLALAFWIAVCILLIASPSARAQSTQPRPAIPPGPLLNPAPEFSQWVITCAYPQDRAEKDLGNTGNQPLEPTAIRKITATKTGTLIHEECVSVGGEKKERWQQGDLVYAKPRGQNFWGVANQSFWVNDPGADPIFQVLPKSGFRNLDWISKDTFAGIISLGNQTLLVFVPKGAASLDLGNPKTAPALLANQETIAFIDESTRLPVSVRKSGVTMGYLFVSNPPKSQALPPDLSRQIQEQEQRRARVNAAPRCEY